MIGWFYFDSITLLFWFDLFLEARAEILYNKFVGFLVDWKTPKGHFEINWPLFIKFMQLKSSKVPLPYVEEQVWGHENVMTASVVPSSQKQNKIISSKSFTKISKMSAQIELEKYLVHTNFIAKNS